MTLYERTLADGRVVSVEQMIFNRRVCISSFPLTYDDGWCYPGDLGVAFVVAAAKAWDGDGDPPPGWIKQVSTGRRRHGGDPAREYVAR